jgi:RHS repeat-associated protein
MPASRVSNRRFITAFAPPLADTTTSFQYVGLAGVETDANGLNYMRARHYNPLIRRFLQQDSRLGGMGDPDTINRYLYALDNPPSNTDPSGFSAPGAYLPPAAVNNLSRMPSGTGPWSPSVAQLQGLLQKANDFAENPKAGPILALIPHSDEADIARNMAGAGVSISKGSGAPGAIPPLDAAYKITLSGESIAIGGLIAASPAGEAGAFVTGFAFAIWRYVASEIPAGIPAPGVPQGPYNGPIISGGGTAAGYPLGYTANGQQSSNGSGSGPPSDSTTYVRAPQLQCPQQ